MIEFFIVFGIVVLDQISKFFVRLLLEVGESAEFIPHIIKFVYVQNDGALFGMLSDASWVFNTFSTIAIAVIVIYFIRHKKRHILLTLSLSFICGGGIGNMIDRIFITNDAGVHVVTDFIKFDFVEFAVFNIADSFVTVGAILFAIYILFFDPNFKTKPKTVPDTDVANGDTTSDKSNDGSDPR